VSPSLKLAQNYFAVLAEMFQCQEEPERADGNSLALLIAQAKKDYE